jgi:hypothetical protein
MSKFTVEIELGNAGMRTPEDVAQALERIAIRVARGDFGDQPGSIGASSLRDENGNKVGRLDVEWPL